MGGNRASSKEAFSYWLKNVTYLVDSREGLARVSRPAKSSPVAEDDRDLIASGLLGVELFSLATVNSEDRGRAVLCSCCLLMRRDAIEASDCFRSWMNA